MKALCVSVCAEGWRTRPCTTSWWITFLPPLVARRLSQWWWVASFCFCGGRWDVTVIRADASMHLAVFPPKDSLPLLLLLPAPPPAHTMDSRSLTVHFFPQSSPQWSTASWITLSPRPSPSADLCDASEIITAQKQLQWQELLQSYATQHSTGSVQFQMGTSCARQEIALRSLVVIFHFSREERSSWLHLPHIRTPFVLFFLFSFPAWIPLGLLSSLTRIPAFKL